MTHQNKLALLATTNRLLPSRATMNKYQLSDYLLAIRVRLKGGHSKNHLIAVLEVVQQDEI